MRVQSTILGFGGLTNPKNHARWISYLARALNRNISYGATMSNKDTDINMSIFKATGTSPGAANTDFTLTHALNRVPITIVGQDTKDGSVLYRSPATAWTKTTVTLRSTGASSIYNVIIA